ncbi:akirin-1-like [Arapaima gigas]
MWGQGGAKEYDRRRYELADEPGPSRHCAHPYLNMACGATLKRSMEFEALLSPQSPKRRRCNPLPGTPATPSPQRCNLRPSTESPSHSMSTQTVAGEHRLTPVLTPFPLCLPPTEQIFQNIKQEYSRYQRRRQLEVTFNQSDGAGPSDGQSSSPALTAPNSPPGEQQRPSVSHIVKCYLHIIIIRFWNINLLVCY